MSVRFTRTMLWLVAVCCLVPAGWIILDAASPREAPSPNSPPTRPVVAADEAIATHPRPTLSDFAPFVDRDLLAPLYDPPPPPPESEPKKPTAPPMAAKLLATMVEPGRSRAVLDVGGSTERVGVGDVVEGATVLQITPGAIVLQQDGERITLTLPERGETAAPAPRPTGRRP